MTTRPAPLICLAAALLGLASCGDDGGGGGGGADDSADAFCAVVPDAKVRDMILRDNPARLYFND